MMSDKSLCFNCGYCWCDDGEKYPTCHVTDPMDAPCNYNDRGDYDPDGSMEYDDVDYEQ